MPIGPAADSRANTAPRRAYTIERREERDLREDPVDVEEALVARCPRHRVAPNTCCRVDVREDEVVRDGGGVQDERSERERSDDERRGEDESQKASPGAGIGANAISSGTCSSGAASTGAPYG